MIKKFASKAKFTEIKQEQLLSAAHPAQNLEVAV